MNTLREAAREYLDALKTHVIVSLLICRENVRTLLRRKRKRGRPPRACRKPGGEGAQTNPDGEAVDDGRLAIVYLLDLQVITCVRFSPDGKRLAYASSDGTVTVLDLQSATPLCVYRGHRDWVTSVDWDPAGVRLVSGSSDGAVRVWEAEGGRTLLHPSVHRREVRAVAWSPDGTRIASAGADRQVRIWRVDGGRPVCCTGHSGQVHALAWSPDGTRLASASKDYTVRLWDAGSGKSLRLWRHGGPVNDVAWSPDGESDLVVAASDDRLVRVWNARTGECRFTYTGHAGYAGVSSCAWARSGRIISADWKQTVQEWTLPGAAQKAVSIVIPVPRVPLLDECYIHTLAAHTSSAGTRMALGGNSWMTVGASPAEPQAMLGGAVAGGRVVLRP